MTRRALADAVKALAVVGPVSRALTASRQRSTPADPVYFDMFRRATATATEFFMPSGFWRKHLLQIAHNGSNDSVLQQAFWHASVAIGALHRYWESGGELDSARRHAAQHYACAAAQARALNSATGNNRPFVSSSSSSSSSSSPPSTPSLALSLALAASANLLGRFGDAQAHILIGFKIATAARQGKTSSEEEASMIGVLARLDFQAMTYSDSLSPYPYSKSARLTLERSSNDGLLRHGEHITSYAHASSTLMDLVRRLMLLQETYSHGTMSESRFLAASGGLLGDLDRWEAEMSSFEKTLPMASIDSCMTAAIAVRLYHTWLRMAIKLSDNLTSEMYFDTLLGYFERIVVLAEAFLARHVTNTTTPGHTMSLEPGIVVILWYAGHRCRHPSLRRRILTVLRGANRSEGMWHSTAAAAAGDFILEVEEEQDSPAHFHVHVTEGQPLWTPATDIQWGMWSLPNFSPRSVYTWDGVVPVPEHRRAKFVIVASNYDRRIVHVSLLMSPTGAVGPLVPTHSTIVKL
ncbi:hypothetical protein N3K66_009032 [Trichothecium roseum]|uniref:Uncharacterized protein n=1 Tax=Trichothecium roseum TaxID=47278 RepID=A0ACC0USB4_9HYPO|nr:hypothetical protein N3K66_009032 [Trichothecium roseum]